MTRSPRFVALALLALSPVLYPWGGPDSRADAKTGPDPAAVARTREQVKMLDDVYKLAVISITKNYVDKQSDTPAAAVAKDVFAQMHKKGWHLARLVDATGRPRRKANLPKTDFEKKAVAEMKAGKAYYEEIGTKDGKDVLRVATVVPAVLPACTICHGGKQGRLLGAIVYEVPIK
jgi:hypothetical protein